MQSQFAPQPGDVEAGHTVYVSRMADGTEVKVLKSKVADGLQRRIDELSDRCERFVILCTGTFEGLRSPVPLVFPDQLLRDEVETRGLGESLHIVMPAPEQQPFLEGKWEPVTVYREFSSASPYQPFQAAAEARLILAQGQPTAVVLDCMGFRLAHKRALHAALSEAGGAEVPIVLPQEAVSQYMRGN